MGILNSLLILLKYWKTTLVVLLLVLFSCFYYSIVYNHKQYLTTIYISPFYEITEDVGFELKALENMNKEELISHFNKNILKINYSRYETKMSPRRPLKHRLDINSDDAHAHPNIINKIKEGISTLNTDSLKSYEERRILKGKIVQLNEDIYTRDEFCSDSLVVNLKLLRKSFEMELENNYHVNYQYKNEPVVVNTFKYQILICLILFPFLIQILLIQNFKSND